MNFEDLELFEIVTLVLNNMGIETNVLTNDTLLEANLGMDSQEVVELQVALEEKCNVKFPAGFLNRDLSISNLVEKLSNLTNHAEKHLIQ